MAIPKEALDLIISFEGYLKRLNDGTDRVRPYLCPANVPTIGYGSTRYFPEKIKVTMGDPPITEARSRECLAGELAMNEREFDLMTTRRVHELSRGAIVSFIYNCGGGAYRASNLRRAINDGRWHDVPAELAKWRRGGGRVLAGLVRRREAEARLFMKGVRAASSSSPPLTVPQPPAPASKPTPSKPATPPRGLWDRFVGWLWS